MPTLLCKRLPVAMLLLSAALFGFCAWTVSETEAAEGERAESKLEEVIVVRRIDDEPSRRVLNLSGNRPLATRCSTAPNRFSVSIRGNDSESAKRNGIGGPLIA